MRKKLARFFSILMIVCVTFLFVGCMGSDPDENDDDFGSGNLDGMAFDMYGTKVLYRPDDYDYNTGSGGTALETNEYYGKYAYWILNDLVDLYGIVDENKLKDDPNETAENPNPYLPRIIANDGSHSISDNEIPYLYDSIRYKVDTRVNITKTTTVPLEGDPTTTDVDAANQQFFIGANLNNAWKWTFDYDLSNYDEGLYNAFLITGIDGIDIYENNHIYSLFTNQIIFENEFSTKYSTNMTTKYKEIYLSKSTSESPEKDTANYSDYVKALEYVIYSYALDLEPRQITVTKNDNVTSATDKFYTVNVQSYNSVDEALADIKDTFETIGSYVGLMQRQITKISDWVCSNVIGANFNDVFTTYSATEVKTEQEDGSFVTTYEVDESQTVGAPLGRNYANAVDNIVAAVCEDVAIGTDSSTGGDLTIDNRFLASEVKEYAGNSFFITGDSNFPAPGASTAKSAIQPLEYQSVQFMLKGQERINDIWIALKYDADLDGTTAGQWDLTKYIDVIVELNYYNHTLNKMFTLGSQQTRVYDGPYKDLLPEDLSKEDTSGLPDDHGSLFFTDYAENCKDPAVASVLDEKGSIIVGAYNTEIGNGILKTDAAEGGYTSKPVSENPLVIVGTTDVRKYYSIIEPTDEELGSSGKTYVTGRANPEMYAGDDGCDYLEVTYKVLKNKGDKTTNYKFYTGVLAVFDAFYAD